ncbi:MAG: DUF4062 domain-containing protein [Tumebacillaceae bacterium]
MKIFVGGTSADIRPYREKVYEVFAAVPLETMENFESSELPVRELCMERVRACSHYLLIIGGRYGWVPPESERGLSITELEYECARELGLPMRIYVLQPGPDHVPPEGDDQEMLTRFKQRVQDAHTTRPFHDLTEFSEVLVRSTRDWYAEAHLLALGSTRMRTLHSAVQAGTVQVPVPQAVVQADRMQVVAPDDTPHFDRLPFGRIEPGKELALFQESEFLEQLRARLSPAAVERLGEDFFAKGTADAAALFGLTRGGGGDEDSSD